MIKVLIADDHHLVRQGIRLLLERAEDIGVVGEARDGEEAVAMVASLSPDVVVIDVTMPGLSGIDATPRLLEARPGVAIVILSMHEDEALVRRALRNGARAYVLKGSLADELLLGIRAAHRGATYLSPQAALGFSHGTEPDPESSEVPALTRREREVISLIGEGLTNRAIAARLGISVKTVERHRTSLMAKLDVHTVVELVREGIRAGLIDLG